MLEHRFVTMHSNLRRNIVGLGFAHKRVQQQSVNGFKRALDYVLVSAMNRVASLKRNHSAPALSLESLASFFRIEPIARKRRIARTIQQTYWSAQQPIALIEKRANSGMCGISCQIDSFCLTLLVVTKLLSQMEHAKQMIVVRVERNVRTFVEIRCQIVGSRERNRNSPRQPGS